MKMTRKCRICRMQVEDGKWESHLMSHIMSIMGKAEAYVTIGANDGDPKACSLQYDLYALRKACSETVVS